MNFWMFSCWCSHTCTCSHIALKYRTENRSWKQCKHSDVTKECGKVARLSPNPGTTCNDTDTVKPTVLKISTQINLSNTYCYDVTFKAKLNHVEQQVLFSCDTYARMSRMVALHVHLIRIQRSKWSNSYSQGLFMLKASTVWRAACWCLANPFY